MFDAVRFQSFKCLADVTIELGRMTLLVGANASGKSSVLDGLHLLCQLGAPTADKPDPSTSRAGVVFSRAFSPARLRTWGQEGSVRIEGSAGGVTALAVDAKPGSDDAEARFLVEFGAVGKAARIVLPADYRNADTFFRQLDRRGFGHVVRLRLDASKVADFAKDAARPRVEHDGAGTAAVLAWLAEQRSPALDAIEADLRKVVPRARRFHLSRAEQGNDLGRLFALEMDSGARIASDLLSEGTLLTIGLLTVLHQPPVPRLVLLDDFDRALHPTAQKQLVLCVKSMLDRHPELQFVCTTHSPYVLDLFDAEDVRVLRTDAKGFTQARKLTDHPEWAEWKGTLKAGEFWSYVGEDWLDAPAHAA
ncbi:AAA family ATPase [Sorangium sp. So ce119]|uniref:AAA family ATPase n=1 Tax=Sorangium sp. So ce119 TaxID=3133279 RepID=UPI003F5E1BC9